MAVLCGFFASAETQVTPVVWTNLVNGTSQWGEAANWVDADGNALTVAPTNAADRFAVQLPLLPDTSLRTIYTGMFSGGDANVYLAPPAVNPSIYSIGGSNDVFDTWRWTVEFTSFTTYKQQQFKRVMTIADPDGFEGRWSTGDAKAVFELAATETHSPVMSALNAAHRPYVRVPDAGTSATVASIYGGGMVSKLGAGELTVGPATLDGEATRYSVEAGTLTVEGRSEAAMDALLAQAAVRFDASREDAFKTFELTADGKTYTCITNWWDANGSDVAGYFESTYKGTDPRYFFTYAHAPFISPVKSPTGLRLVDFGSHARHNGELGPSNCWLRLTKPVNGVREVFYAVQTAKGSNGCTIMGQVGNDGLSLITEYSDQQLFCTYGAGEAGRRGDIIINGEAVNFSDTAAGGKYAYNGALTNLNVISVGIADRKWQYGLPIFGMIACERHYHTRSGGSRIGEILAYTNALTHAERLRISQYLTRKWVTGKGLDLDAGAVYVQNGSSVGVPAGSKARVGTVSAANGMVKTGAGTLEVGTLSPAGADIEVRGGDVKFASVFSAPDDSAPAPGPWIWLDANDDDRFEWKSFGANDEHDYFTAWGDHRDDSALQAFAVSNTLPRIPWRETDAATGLKVVNLGVRNQGTQSWLGLPNWGPDGEYGAGTTLANLDTYAAFIVYRPNSLNWTGNILGSSDFSMFKSGYNRLCAYSYCHYLSPAAAWSLNGVPCDPWDASVEPIINQTDDLILLSFRSDAPLTLNALGKDRDRASGQHLVTGNFIVGEFLSYHRRLTPEEFRATEAYLLKKWKGVAHPVTAATEIGKLSFAAGTEAALASDVPMNVGEVASAGSSLVKRGTGAVTVGTILPGAVASSVSVEGGSLTANIGYVLDDITLFHFDASDVSTLRYTVSDDLAVTNVTRWFDVRGNGQYARSEWDAQTLYKNYCVADPTLVTKEVAPGVFAPALDFGDKRNTSSGPATVTNSAAMRFKSAKDADVTYSNVHETFIVVAQRGSGYNNLLGSTSSSVASTEPGRSKANDGNYMRSGAVLFNATYCHPAFTNASGTVFVDGESVKGTSYQFTADKGFQLIEFRPGTNTLVGALALDRNCNAGGCYLCEVIGFNRVLTDDERTSLRAQLRHKWFGKAAPQTDIATLAVASGATLDVGDSSVVAKTLSGGGVLKCSGLTVREADDKPAELKIGWRSSTDVDGETVLAPVSFPNGVHVTVTFEYEKLHDVTPGEWTVFTANDLTLDPSALTVGDNLNGRRRVSAFVRDNTIVLKVEPRGSVLIVR